MLRQQNRSIEGLSKIRKRGCSSNSSSSSLLQNYRFKRAILVGKRGGGSTTPVPTWKLVSRSPYSSEKLSESPMTSKAKQPPVSARKLAATLWELNEIPSPRLRDEPSKKEMITRDRISRRSARSGSLPSNLSDPSHSPSSDRMDRLDTSSTRRRSSAVSRRIQHSDYNTGGFDSHSTVSLVEIEMRSRAETPSGSALGTKTRLKDLSNGLTTSRELLKILKRFWGNEEQRSSSLSLISALNTELERACVQVDGLIKEQRYDKHEIDYLMKQVAEEKAAWKRKEKEKIRDAVEMIAGELEVERKMRRRSESMNKKLGTELSETKTSLSKALKEVESEKRARQIIEQVCDELARGIGEDKAEAEELKRESAKVWEEVEKEREMLQLADVLREERLQMKLSEAKYQFEEKNAAVDQLKNQLETFLRTERSKENQIRSCNNRADAGNFGDEHEEDNGEVENGDVHKEEVNSEEDSAESDLHSIELNMENNSRSYKWNHTARAVQEDSRRDPIMEELKGRKLMTEKLPRRSISLEKHNSDGIGWDFTEKFSNPGDGYDLLKDKQNRVVDFENGRRSFKSEDGRQSFKSVKGLKDHNFSELQMASVRTFASPTRQWGQPWPSRGPGNAIREKSTMSRETGLKPSLVEAIGGDCRSSRHSRR